FLGSETAMDNAVNNVSDSFLTRLLFQDEDAGTGNPHPRIGEHFTKALRNLFQVGGRPIIVRTAKTLKPSDYTDSADFPIMETGLAYVVRFKITIKFVSP